MSCSDQKNRASFMTEEDAGISEERGDGSDSGTLKHGKEQRRESLDESDLSFEELMKREKMKFQRADS